MTNMDTRRQERAKENLERAQRRFAKCEERAARQHELYLAAVEDLEDAAKRMQYAESHPDLPEQMPSDAVAEETASGA